MLAQKTIKPLMVFLSLALANTLAGCGKKGPPEAPPGSLYEFPGGYPHPDEAE